MDLERIKQNLRLRSGRNKSKKKPTKKVNAPAGHSDSPKSPQTLPNGHIVNGDHTKQESEKQAQDTEGRSAASLPEPAAEKDKAQDTASVEETRELDEQLDPPPDTTAEPPPSSSPVAKDTTNIADEEDNLADGQPPAKFHTMSESHMLNASSSSEAEDFDLSPPKSRKPRSKPPSIEPLAELLFSSDHLNCLLHNPPQLTLFSTFLQKYLPDTFPLLSQYLETQKAIKAVEYANAVAYGFKPEDIGDGTPTEVRKIAATLDPEFETVCNAAFDALVGTALPQYITYQLIKICSECLTNEVTGRQSTAVMRDYVGGLSEVFCLADPSQEDTPIIYASEEFYRLTGYGEEDVIGNNCRFLQGKNTNPASRKRLKETIARGEHVYETILNYRRDGKPFINVLLIAPLYDKDNKVKYYIGAQVDVTGLVEGGRALPGFQHFLNRRDQAQQREQREKDGRDTNDEQKRKSRALARLRDLSEMFDLEESAVVRQTSRANSLTREDDETGSIASVDRLRTPRRVLADSDDNDDSYEADKEDEDDASEWKLAEPGSGKLSGKLPGIYDSFLLFRPYPSLRIVFLSPKLRKFNNALQTPMLSHIAAPGGILRGLTESLKAGIPVSAKVHFKPERNSNREGTQLKKGTKHEDGKYGKAIWIACTPMVGVDERVGVWMCVVVEKTKVAGMRESYILADQTSDGLAMSVNGRSNAEIQEENQADQARKSRRGSQDENTSQNETEELKGLEKRDIPIKPVRMTSNTVIKGVAEQSPETPPGRIADSTTTNSNKDPDPESSPNGDNISNLTQSPNLEPTGQDGALEKISTANSTASAEAVKDPEVASNNETTHPSKPYSVDLPNYAPQADEPDASPTDEYVATRTAVSSSQTNGRVVIVDDSDSVTDDHAEDTQDAEDAQDDEITSQEQHHRSDSASPVWSPASEIPPSIPSDAQSSSSEELVTGDSASQTREAAPPALSDQVTPTEERQKSLSPREDVKHEPMESSLTPTPATPNEDTTPLVDDEGDEEDKTLVSQVQRESDEYDHRPVMSIDTSSNARMDYLRAGSGRWQQGRNPRRVDLTQENFHLAGLEHRDAEDWFSDPDCAASPYSVD